MSATAEKKPATRRSRLEIVEAALAKDEAALEAARARFVELAAAEDAAVRKAKHAAPAENVYKLGSRPQSIRLEREKLDKAITALETQVLALQAELAVASSEQAERELEERIKQAKRLAERELTLRRDAAEAFAELVARWNALADCLSKRTALVNQVGGEQLTQRVSDHMAKERWEAAARYGIEPVPVELATFLDELLEASTAERVDIEAELNAVDELNARRREFAKRDPGGADDLPPIPRPRLEPNKLHELVPDLRDKLRRADVGSAPVRQRPRPEPPWSAPWPGEAA